MIPAPWETFSEARKREESGEPYNREFINKCREKALEYNKEEWGKNSLLKDLWICIPFHRRKEVFEGISWRPEEI
jgi:hypothetical protein